MSQSSSFLAIPHHVDVARHQSLFQGRPLWYALRHNPTFRDAVQELWLNDLFPVQSVAFTERQAANAESRPASATAFLVEHHDIYTRSRPLSACGSERAQCMRDLARAPDAPSQQVRSAFTSSGGTRHRTLLGVTQSSRDLAIDAAYKNMVVRPTVVVPVAESVNRSRPPTPQQKQAQRSSSGAAGPPPRMSAALVLRTVVENQRLSSSAAGEEELSTTTDRSAAPFDRRPLSSTSRPSSSTPAGRGGSRSCVSPTNEQQQHDPFVVVELDDESDDLLIQEAIQQITDSGLAARKGTTSPDGAFRGGGGRSSSSMPKSQQQQQPSAGDSALRRELAAKYKLWAVSSQQRTHTTRFMELSSALAASMQQPSKRPLLEESLRAVLACHANPLLAHQQSLRALQRQQQQQQQHEEPGDVPQLSEEELLLERAGWSVADLITWEMKVFGYLRMNLSFGAGSSSASRCMTMQQQLYDLVHGIPTSSSLGSGGSSSVVDTSRQSSHSANRHTNNNHVSVVYQTNNVTNPSLLSAGITGTQVVGAGGEGSSTQNDSLEQFVLNTTPQDLSRTRLANAKANPLSPTVLYQHRGIRSALQRWFQALLSGSLAFEEQQRRHGVVPSADSGGPPRVTTIPRKMFDQLTTLLHIAVLGGDLPTTPTSGGSAPLSSSPPPAAVDGIHASSAAATSKWNTALPNLERLVEGDWKRLWVGELAERQDLSATTTTMTTTGVEGAAVSGSPSRRSRPSSPFVQGAAPSADPSLSSTLPFSQDGRLSRPSSAVAQNNTFRSVVAQALDDPPQLTELLFSYAMLLWMEPWMETALAEERELFLACFFPCVFTLFTAKAGPPPPASQQQRKGLSKAASNTATRSAEMCVWGLRSLPTFSTAAPLPVPSAVGEHSRKMDLATPVEYLAELVETLDAASETRTLRVQARRHEQERHGAASVGLSQEQWRKRLTNLERQRTLLANSHVTSTAPTLSHDRDKGWSLERVLLQRLTRHVEQRGISEGETYLEQANLVVHAAKNLIPSDCFRQLAQCHPQVVQEFKEVVARAAVASTDPTVNTTTSVIPHASAAAAAATTTTGSAQYPRSGNVAHKMEGTSLTESLVTSAGHLVETKCVAAALSCPTGPRYSEPTARHRRPQSAAMSTQALLGGSGSYDAFGRMFFRKPPPPSNTALGGRPQSASSAVHHAHSSSAAQWSTPHDELDMFASDSNSRLHNSHSINYSIMSRPTSVSSVHRLGGDAQKRQGLRRTQQPRNAVTAEELYDDPDDDVDQVPLPFPNRKGPPPSSQSRLARSSQNGGEGVNIVYLSPYMRVKALPVTHAAFTTKLKRKK